ncbi:MAG: type 4a pilus biogenesis protein PilO [Gammaproteobacteria bacterium]|nr:type 4a pilus biogenesis protein PilO [Gammaproteobacteria bacterium]
MELSSLNELDFNESGEWPLGVKVAAIALLCILVWAGGYYYIIKDKEVALASAEKKEETLKKTLEVKYAKAVNLEAYKKQMEEMKVVFSSMLKQLPRKSEVADLLIDISSSGLVNGLEFQLFKPGGERPIDFYAELPIQMKVTGTFHQFGEFVSAVASLPRIVTMHNLTLTPLGTKSDKMTMDITAKTYRYFDEQ